MDGIFTKFIGTELLSDPIVAKLLMIIIFFLGASQVVKLMHSFWITGKIKVQEKQVTEDKGKWKDIIEQLVNELKIRNERADKIYDMVRWLHDSHNKFDEGGVPLWYRPKGFEKAMEKLAENIDKQTIFLDRMINEIKDTRRDISSLKTEMESHHRQTPTFNK